MDIAMLSSDMIIGIILGVGIPMLLWATRIFYLVKQTRDMHLSPDKYGFGTINVEKLLSANLETQAENQREYLHQASALRYAFKELSHYMRWSIKQGTGKEPPPYVRKNDD